MVCHYETIWLWFVMMVYLIQCTFTYNGTFGTYRFYWPNKDIGISYWAMRRYIIDRPSNAVVSVSYQCYNWTTISILCEISSPR